MFVSDVSLVGPKFQLTHFNSWLKGEGYETLLSYLYDLYLVLYMECTLASTYLGFLALPLYVCSCKINKSEMFREAMASCLLLFALIRVPQQPEEWRCLRLCNSTGHLFPFTTLLRRIVLGDSVLLQSLIWELYILVSPYTPLRSLSFPRNFSIDGSVALLTLTSFAF